MATKACHVFASTTQVGLTQALGRKTMAIIATTSKVHWNYFIALEHDLEVASRYVEFASSNMGTYSIEFAHLLFAAASEVDVVAKLLCKRLDPSAPQANIDQYRQVLRQHIPDLAQIQVIVPRYGLTLTPWVNWTAGNNNPDWWRSYNNVKHERDVYFQEATLKNALNSLAGLLALVFYHYGLAGSQNAAAIDKKETTNALQPESTLLQFNFDFYYDKLVC